MALLGGGAGVGLAYALVRWAGTGLPGAFRSRVASRWIGRLPAFALAVSITAGILFGLAPATQIGTRRTEPWPQDWRNAYGRRCGQQPAFGFHRRAGGPLADVAHRRVPVDAIVVEPHPFAARLLRRTTCWSSKSSCRGKARLPRPTPFSARHNGASRPCRESRQPARSARFLPSTGMRAPAMTRTGYLAHRTTMLSTSSAPHVRRLPRRDGYSTAGRACAPRERCTVVLVNQEFVRRYLPGGNPVGKHLVDPSNQVVNLEIVGVIGNVRGTAGSIAGEGPA